MAKPLEIIPQHAKIHIVIPWDETLMPDSAKKCPCNHKIRYASSITNPLELIG